MDTMSIHVGAICLTLVIVVLPLLVGRLVGILARVIITWLNSKHK